jgi:hypothetical protein
VPVAGPGVPVAGPGAPGTARRPGWCRGPCSASGEAWPDNAVLNRERILAVSCPAFAADNTLAAATKRALIVIVCHSTPIGGLVTHKDLKTSARPRVS